MHNLTSDVHKPSSMLRKLENDDHTTQKEGFEHQDRLARVLALLVKDTHNQKSHTSSMLINLQ